MKSYNYNYFKSKEDISGTVAKGCLAALLAVVLLIGLTFLYAAIGCWLWGAIMVPVFGLPTLTYWQMYGIIVLARIIFGSHSSVSTSNK